MEVELSAFQSNVLANYSTLRRMKPLCVSTPTGELVTAVNAYVDILGLLSSQLQICLAQCSYSPKNANLICTPTPTSAFAIFRKGTSASVAITIFADRPNSGSRPISSPLWDTSIAEFTKTSTISFFATFFTIAFFFIKNTHLSSLLC